MQISSDWSHVNSTRYIKRAYSYLKDWVLFID
jgi:hypothetical protein